MVTRIEPVAGWSQEEDHKGYIGCWSGSLVTGTYLRTQQEDIVQGIKYCPGVDNFILPVYRPVKYKPGFSGNRDLAEQKHFSQLCKKVCASCKDGPRCKYSNVKEIYSARSIATPSAIGDMVAHIDCVKTVPTVQMYRAGETDLAQSKGDTHKLSVSSNITTLIEKWEGKGGLKAGCKGEEGGSSSRRVSQEFEKTRNIYERGSQSFNPTENVSSSFSSIKTLG
jgi:hypothetical protein